MAEQHIVHTSIVCPKDSSGGFIAEAELHPCPIRWKGRHEGELEGEAVCFSIAGARNIFSLLVKVALPSVQSNAYIYNLVIREVKHTDSAADGGGARQELNALQLQLVLPKPELQLLIRGWDAEDAGQVVLLSLSLFSTLNSVIELLNRNQVQAKGIRKRNLPSHHTSQ